MKQIVRSWDIFLYGIQGMILSLLIKLGPFLVAVMPGLFTGYAIYFRFLEEAGHGLALAFAIITALALETVGIVSTHTAINLYNAMSRKIIKPVKFKLMAWLVPVYVGGVSSVVFFSGDAFSDLVRSLGIASPVLTCIVYIAVALARDITQIEEAQEVIETKEDNSEADELARQHLIEDEERQRRYAQEDAEAERKHEARMAKINRPRNVQSSKLDDRLDDAPVQGNGQISKFNIVNSAHLTVKEAKLDALVEFLASNPSASYAQIGRYLDMSKSSGENYTKQLILDGKIIRNGSGWEAPTREAL